MSTPARRGHTQEGRSFTFDHPAVTASTLWRVFKADRKFRVDRIRYYNATGLAENASNAFDVSALRLQATTADALTVADKTFTAANASEIFTATAHGLLTGDGPVQVSNSGGALPTGLSAATDYYVIKIDADTFYLATTREKAYAGTNLAITSDGTGTQTLSDVATTTRPKVVASGIDTDSDEAGTNTLVADLWTDLTVTEANSILEAGEELGLLAREDGTATLPAGRFLVEGRYIAPTAP